MENSALKFHNMCRACKLETDCMISIDQEEICENNVITPANMLMTCTSVKVSETPDGLPREMCLKCVEQLKSAFTFKKQCEDTDTFLRNCLLENGIKSEEWGVNSSTNLEEGAEIRIEAQNNNIKEEPDDKHEINSKRKRSRQTRAKKQELDKGIKVILNNIQNESNRLDVSKRGRIRKPVIKYEDEPDPELSDSYDFTEVDASELFNDNDDSQSITDPEWTASDNEVIAPKQDSDNEDTEENQDSTCLPKPGRPRKGKNSEHKIYECPHCTMKFKSKVYLKQHQSIHDDETPFICEICPERFARRDQLIEHTKGHLSELNHDCEICGQKLETIEQLAKHKFSKHTAPNKPQVKKEKVKYKCDTCGKMFSSPKHLENHVYLAHNKVYYCKSCTLPFCGREAFYIHNTRSNDCSKKYLCPDCGARFSATSALKVHIRRHRGEKPFKCQYCEKGFSRKFDLITHETRHRGEKNHLCPICGKGFNRRHMLTIHMRTHTGEKPYKCSYCDAAFTQNNDLKTHIRRHTGERFVCDICNEKFLMHYLLSKHKRVVHGINIPPAKPILERVTVEPADMLPTNKIEPEMDCSLEENF